MTNKLIQLIITSLITIGNLSAQHSNFGLFDNNIDIGECKNKGKAIYNSDDQTYTINGSGKNMWGAEDQFHYLWTTLQGDFILTAEVKFLSQGVNAHRKAGWIVKNNLDNNTKHINATTHGDGLTSLQYRKTTGGETEEITTTDKSPDVIRLERKGNNYIMSTAKFGEEFTSIKLENIEMDNEVFVGLYVCSHDENVVESATFRNVRIVQPADDNFRPYQDYIGSHLEIMDIETGLRKIVFSSAHSIQAPNWSPDGKQLIYNSKGRLYGYDVKSGSINPINTGFANNNNNDHVLTFDGSLLGISHHNSDDGGNSTLYYLPSKGDNNPIQVTKTGVGPSYLHGWSTDNTKMIFTGERNNQYDLFAVDVKTGKETQLTNQKTLDDGSEYSPDGKYIFFNSARTGKMQIWRMDANGKNKKQLTFDEYNDWFPHVSPDKKWVVFISFPKDINPGDHPFYKRCLLRIMPFEGGEPKTIAYIYGGQGTMNVPSWSPDSKRISFITNTKR